jgi:hypothetical protein
LITAARLAVAANVLDLGVPGALTPERVLASQHGVLDGLFHGDATALSVALTGVRRVFHLADNAGELAVDRLLIEQIGPDRVTLVVRGGPIIRSLRGDPGLQAGEESDPWGAGQG